MMTVSPPKSRLASETRMTKPHPGVTLLSRQTDSNEIVSVEIVIPMGSREEPPEVSGIGTLVLRMLMRGTHRKTDYDIAVGLESLGSSFSMEVAKDRGILSVQTTLDHFAATMELVKEVLTEPTFPEEFFEIEKEILKKEIIEDLDSPYYSAVRLFQSTLFGEHPYSHPNIGTQETVSALTRKKVLDYYESRFWLGPVSVGVVGNLEIDQAEEILSELLHVLGRAETGSSTPVSIPSLATPREAFESRSIESECMVYGFPVPGIHSRDYACLKVIDSIMGGSMDSRLFTEVREKQGLVYQIGSTYPGLEWGSFFAISLITTAPNHDKVLETLEREIERIRSEPPEEDEVTRAKTYLQGTYLMSQEKNSDQALLLARYHSLGLGIDYIDRYPQSISEVEPESLQKVAERYFRQPTLAVVGPEHANS